MPYGPKPQPIESRFWARVKKSSDPDGCWLWTGSTNGRYGVFRINNPRSQVYVHRLSWQWANNAPLPDEVCHSCDVPLCVRPSHLWAGTSAANHADMAAKGRGTIGERNAMAKLTDHQVRRIRKRHGQSIAAIAREYGVSAGTIRLVLRRATWKHV